MNDEKNTKALTLYDENILNHCLLSSVSYENNLWCALKFWIIYQTILVKHICWNSFFVLKKSSHTHTKTNLFNAMPSKQFLIWLIQSIQRARVNVLICLKRVSIKPTDWSVSKSFFDSVVTQKKWKKKIKMTMNSITNMMDVCFYFIFEIKKKN